jgi:K+-transporting ATPase ATPase C chain
LLEGELKMFSDIKAQLKPAILMFVALTVITGIVYPLAITATAQGAFSTKANGSIVSQDGRNIGSELIGQPFSTAKYFWSRPSATGPFPYNASSSSGSNLGPTNPALLDGVKGRIEVLRKSNSDAGSIPVDLVTTSASGLDPHISPSAAHYQIARVARERHMTEERIRELVEKFTEDRQLGFLGEARVHVLKLNMALDSESGH